jgi:hypothetical protein
MKRPAGVFILAVLDFMGTISLILYGLTFQFRMFQSFAFLPRLAIVNPIGELGTLLVSAIELALMKTFAWGSLLIMIPTSAVVCFVFAAIAGIAGYGMLKLKGWARTGNIVFAILGMAGPLLRFFLPQLFLLPAYAKLLPHNFVSFIYLGIRIAMNVLILWYLLRPQVRAAFAGGRSAAVQA